MDRVVWMLDYDGKVPSMLLLGQSDQKIFMKVTKEILKFPKNGQNRPKIPILL